MTEYNNEFRSELAPQIDFYLGATSTDQDEEMTCMKDTLPSSLNPAERYWICWMLSWIGKFL